jgi:hypothetical protein
MVERCPVVSALANRQRCTHTDRAGDECQDQTLIEYNGHNVATCRSHRDADAEFAGFAAPLRSSSHAPETVSGFSSKILCFHFNPSHIEDFEKLLRNYALYAR